MQYLLRYDSPTLPKEGIKLVQSIIGAALYLEQMIDNTIFMACNDIATQKTTATIKTLNLCTWLLDYMYTYQNPSITYREYNMQL